MNPITLGIAGGILGTILSLLATLAGVYFSLKDADNAVEKSFIIKTTILIWFSFVIMMILPLSLSMAKQIPSWIPYSSICLFWIMMIPAMIWGTRRVTALHGKKEAGGQRM